MELRQRGISDSDPKPELTSAETRAVTKLMGRSAGKKLLEDRVLETPELRSSLARGMSALLVQCKNPMNH